MRFGSYRWWLLALLGGAYFFHQADRALFGVLTPYVQSDLGLTKLQIGHISTVLFLTVGVVTFLAGFLGDRFSRKWIITFSLMAWSLATVALGFAGDLRVAGVTVSAYLCVMFLRSVATGGGESFYAPSAMSLLAAYHEKTRSLAFSIHQAALYIGLMSSGFLALWTLGLLGTWRCVFVAFGAAGFLLGVLFIWALREPERTKAAPSVPARLPLGENLKAFFGNPSALLATTGFVAIVCVNNAYLVWAPTLFAGRFGVDAVRAGADAMFYHHLVAFGAILAGGWLTDRFVGRYPRFRLGLQIAALLGGAPALVLIGRSGSFVAAVVLTAAYGLFRGLFEVNTHASVFDVVPARYRASVVGFMLLLAMTLGALFSGELVGWVLHAFPARGYSICFLLMGATYLLAALCMSVSFFFTFHRSTIPPFHRFTIPPFQPCRIMSFSSCYSDRMRTPGVLSGSASFSPNARSTEIPNS